MAERTDQQPDDFTDRVHDREQRRLDPNRRDRNIFLGLGLFGVVGWSVTIPTVAATFLGVWIDTHFPSRYSWTLMLLGIGLGLGCANAWHWLQRERQSIVGKEERKAK